MNHPSLFILQALFLAISETKYILILSGLSFCYFQEGKGGVEFLRVGESWPQGAASALMWEHFLSVLAEIQAWLFHMFQDKPPEHPNVGLGPCPLVH